MLTAHLPFAFSGAVFCHVPFAVIHKALTADSAFLVHCGNRSKIEALLADPAAEFLMVNLGDEYRPTILTMFSERLAF